MKRIYRLVCGNLMNSNEKTGDASERNHEPFTPKSNTILNVRCCEKKYDDEIGMFVAFECMGSAYGINTE